MATGRIKKVFPGGNTAYGFYSFYDQILRRDTQRIIMLNGVPREDQSGLMLYLAEAVLARGLDVEILCSSDNASLDGINIPDINVALTGSTAPHTVDQQTPGTVNEIVHLGKDSRIKAPLRIDKGFILSLSRQVSQHFARAYRYLAQAKLLKEDIDSYYSDAGAVDPAGLNHAKRDVASGIFGEATGTDFPSSRHLFASAITPDGCVNHFPTVFGHLHKRIIVRGANSQARTSIVSGIYREALDRGYFVEAYHCALIPDIIEHLAIPALDVALVSSERYHQYPPGAVDTCIDLEHITNNDSLTSYRDDLAEAWNRFQAALDRAVDFLKRARLAHYQMEKHCSREVNSDAMAVLRDRTLQQIMAYIEEARRERRPG